MSRIRKYGKTAAVVVVLLGAAQAGVSLLARTHSMHGYLIAHLERAFGRPVEVRRFSVQILPIPEVDAVGVTIGEDPAFGHEYFLRAENMAASLRWMGLLRGHFEFGTMSLTRPSLILVRNAQGRWNLEDWLPPVKAKPGDAGTFYGPQQPAESTHHLEKIEFDEGRVNFKEGEEKRPFAFTGVSGSVEQVSPGRWELRMEAQPWRSGVTLQSTGILQVRGDVAGTTARLQPAQIQLHWGRASIADLFRLATGNDPGVRGEFAVDGTASVGKENPGDAAAGQWQFALQARTTQIHRWDLTERNDNPRVNVSLKGKWNLVAGTGHADEMTIELPASSLHGSADRCRLPGRWSGARELTGRACRRRTCWRGTARFNRTWRKKWRWSSSSAEKARYMDGRCNGKGRGSPAKAGAYGCQDSSNPCGLEKYAGRCAVKNSALSQCA